MNVQPCGWLGGAVGQRRGSTSGQGVGGYNLSQEGTVHVERILDACGVRSWEQLVGRTIYVLTDENARVVGIENLPTEKGKAFLFAEATS